MLGNAIEFSIVFIDKLMVANVVLLDDRTTTERWCNMQTQVKKLVGRIDNSYYICDTLFEHADDFKGATATVLCPVTRNDYEDRTDPYNSDTIEYFEECWKMAVQAGATTDSLEGWVENVLMVDDDEAVFDFSGYEYWELLRETVPELTEEDYPVLECIGGGRSFSPECSGTRFTIKSFGNK